MLRIQRTAVALAVVVAAVVAVSAGAGPARAVTVNTVTTTDDVIAADADLSLREAFTAANTDADDSVIELGSGLTYTLDLDELIEIADDRVARALTDAECATFLRTKTCPDR